MRDGKAVCRLASCRLVRSDIRTQAESHWLLFGNKLHPAVVYIRRVSCVAVKTLECGGLTPLFYLRYFVPPWKCRTT